MSNKYKDPSTWDDAWAIAEREKLAVVAVRGVVGVDGDQCYCLHGHSLQDGIAGFGPTPIDAMREFEREWKKSKGGE